MDNGTPKYKRIILKVTGEVFAGPQNFGIDANTVRAFAQEIKEVKELGCELALVIGGGNIFRGAIASEIGMDRASADTMGMLATVINSLALQDALEKLGVSRGCYQRSKCVRWRNLTSGDAPRGIWRRGEW